MYLNIKSYGISIIIIIIDDTRLRRGENEGVFIFEYDWKKLEIS